MRAGLVAERPWRAVLLLAILFSAAGFVSLYSIGNLKDEAVSMSLHGQGLSPTGLLSVLGLPDVLAAAVGLATLVTTVRLELRGHLLSSFIDTAPDRAFHTVFGIMLAWLGHAYLFSGVLLAGDTGTHIARFHEIRMGMIQDHALPGWTNFQYLGSSLLGFTGPLTYVIGGILDYFVQDASTTAKLLLFVLHMIAGCLCFALLRRLGLSRFAAGLGALAYAGSFAHIHLFLYRGVFPQAFTICFLLTIFLTAEGVMRARRMPWLEWAIFALATAGLIINHQPHAPFVAIYLALFGAVRLATGHWRLAAVPRLAAAGLLGAVMSMVAVLPVLAEAKWVMIEPGNSLFSLTLPTPHRLFDLVMWRNSRTTWGTDYWAYLGLVTIVLAVVGTVAAARQRFAGDRASLVLAVLPCLALSFFLSNPVVRDIMFLLLFVTILAACGADALRERLSHLPRAGLAMLVLLLLDLSSTAIQPVARNDKQFQVEAGRYLEATAPGARVIQLTLGGKADIGPDAGAMSYAALVQRVAGYHNMAATKVHNYATTAVKLAEADLHRNGAIAPQNAELLALFNVSRVYCTSPTSNGCPATFAGARLEGPLGLTVPIAGASPVLFSRQLIAAKPRPDLDKPMFWDDDFTEGNARIAQTAGFLRAWLGQARPDWKTRQAKALPVLDMPNVVAAQVDTAPWTPQLEAYTVTVSKVTATVSANRSGYVQLAHAWFPGNAVRVNGRAVQSLEGSLHLVVVPIGSGTSRIEITPVQTPVRRLSAAISLGALLLTLLIALVGRYRQRRLATLPAANPGLA
ncbi:MAG: hypothetical protein ABIM50_08850 [Novosphingobium sp.]